MNRTILLLAAGYLGGMYVASRYGSGKKGGTTTSFRDFSEELMRIHKEAFSEVESSELGREVRSKLSSLQRSLRDEANAFTKEAEELITRLTKEGKMAAKDIENELRSTYARRKEIISDMQDAGVEQIAWARNAVKDLGRETLESLEAQYEKIRKTIKSNA